MRSVIKTLQLVAASAALFMAVTLDAASARQFTTSRQNFRAIWTPLSFAALGGLIQVRCNVTLNGSYHYRTITKTRTLVGSITDARLSRPCTGGEAWFLNGVERPTSTLPWPLFYDSFTGTLPRIRRNKHIIIHLGPFIIALGNQCLYESTASSPAAAFVDLNETTGEATSMTADAEARIPLKETLAGSCPASGSYAGTTTTFDDREGVRIVIRLI